MRLFSFSTLIGAGALLGHLYVYLRVVRPAVRSRAGRAAAIAVMVLMTAVVGARRRVADLLPPDLVLPMAQAAYTWLGLLMCLVVACLLSDAGWVAWRLARRVATDASPPDPARREALARTVAVGTGLAGLSTAGYGAWRAFTAPEVSEVAVPVPRLPPALDGLTIVQLTDLHVGPFIGRRFMDAIVAQVNALKPDVVAITGDLVDGDVPTLGPAVAALGNLRARFGRYFVTGNHEYYSGEVEWAAFLESQGIHVLRNRRVPIGDAGGTIDLVGVDDWSGWRRRRRPGYDLDKALAGRAAERAAVLLAHQPANFDVVAQRGIDLQLSGHTHGGQIFPATMAIGLAWQFTRGLYRREGSHLYVSRGCGFWGPPMRVGSPPEIVKVSLVTRA